MDEAHTSSPAPSRPRTVNMEEIHRATSESPTHHNTHLDSNSPITNLYLTFETPLPQSSTTTSSSSPPSPPTTTPLPSSPNLIPYTSPILWPTPTKNLMLLLSCTATFLTAYTSGSYSPPQHLILQSLPDAHSAIAVLTGITSFCFGFGLAPMFLAPFSEMNGRYPVFVISGVVYVVFQAVCGVVDSLVGMIAARGMVGIGASVFSTMVGGVIADMWEKEGRNTPMALFSGSVVAGTGAGPLVAAVMAWRMDDFNGGDGDGGTRGKGNLGLGARWKWIFWHQVVMGAVLMGFLVVFFRESRGSVLLSRRAGRVNKWYGELERRGFYGVWVDDGGEGEGGGGILGEALTDGEERGWTGGDDGAGAGKENSSLASNGKVLKRIRWIVKEDEERSSIGKMIAISVTRPFGMLFTEPVVFFFSLYVSFAWGILYLTFGCIPLVFKRQYGWNLEKGGWVFVCLIIAAILSTTISILQERILYQPQWRAVAELDEQSGVEIVGSSRHSLPDIEHQNPFPQNNSSSRTEDDEKTATSSSALYSSPTPLPPSPFWTFMRRRFPAEAPESRLYFTCLTSTLLPIGMFIFGFSARPSIHWIVPSIGITIAAMGILSIYLAVFNYLADTYHRYASSALAAQSLCRNIIGGLFPLVTALMLDNMGEARAIGMLGGIATGLTAVPWVLVLFGERIRARSPFASQLEI